MKPFFRVRLFKRTLTFLMHILVLIFIFLYILLPLVFRFWPAFQRHMVFLPFIRWPTGVDFNQPESQGLQGTRNFYLETEPGIKVGVWHMLPKSLIGKDYKKAEDSFSDGLFPIIVYLHGNSGSRAGSHRIELYKILQSLEYHILTIDYRGYADSTTDVIMSENGAVTDASCLYNYVKKFSGDAMLVVWGHSLGTGVASKLVSEQCVNNKGPHRLVLEAPFNNILDEVRHHPLSFPFRPIPGFEWLFIEPLEANNLAFKSDVHIGMIDCPVLILHAQDDSVIPISLAKKLYQSAIELRSSDWPPVQFIEFHAQFGYSHKYICRAPELPSIIQEFVDPSSGGQTSGLRMITSD